MKGNLVLFSVGLAATMATQLRLENYPVGVGEGLLVVWAWLSWVTIIRRKGISLVPEIRQFLLFFAVVLVLILFSLLYQLNRTGDLFDRALRDLVAYAFVAVLVLTFSLLRPSREYLDQSLKILVVTLSLSLAVLLVISKFTVSLGPVQLDTGHRFLGLARNPNQIGMAMAPVPFLCLLFLREATTGLRRFGYAIILGLALWVGISTGSDASWLAWVVGAILCAALVLLTKVTGRIHPVLTIGNLLGIGVLALVILLVTPVGSFIFERLVEGDGGGRSGGHRLDQWSQAVALILESPIIGRGPGHQAFDVVNYVAGEAHNSYLDLALATGLLGAGAALWLIGSLILRPSLLARPLLWSAFMAMQCFIMFHYMFRHPLFWFYAILMTSLAYQNYAIRRRAYPQPALPQTRLGPQRA